jgi:SAM-dependent methyltransferase
VSTSSDAEPDGSRAAAAQRASSFGAVAAAYERVRPGYPDAMFDDLLEYAGPVSRVLEAGAGTGRATAVLAGRGLSVHAVEHDAAMASVLVARLPSVQVTVGAFETTPLEVPYDLLVSAQAWHWMDPHLRWAKAASCLRPGGTLALFWNHDLPSDPDLCRLLQAAHDRWTPGIRVGDRPSADNLLGEWPGPHLLELRDFTDVEARGYAWRRRLTGEEYVALLSTMSAYNVRPSDAREGLFAEVLEIVGDELVLDMGTALYLARRV